MYLFTFLYLYMWNKLDHVENLIKDSAIVDKEYVKCYKMACQSG